MSFKEDVKNIELPKELHERSLKGVKKSVKESQKNNPLKPKIVTFVVTAAMLWFVFNQLNGDPSTNITTASTKDNGLPPIAISIATIVTVVALVVSIYLWLKKRVSRLLLTLSFMALMSTTWITSLKYTYELVDTEIYPISHEVVWENENITYSYLSLNYMQPKSKAPILRLYLNDKSYSIYHYNNQTAAQPLPFRLFNEFTNAIVIIPIEDIPDLIKDEPIQARVLFADYTQMNVDVELFTIINQSEINASINSIYNEVTKHSRIITDEIQLLKDTYIEQIEFPKRIVGTGSWTLAINNEVIQDGPISAERFDLSRTISKDDIITLTYEVPKKLIMPLNSWIYFIENNSKTPIIGIYEKATLTGEYLRMIINKQRGEQREN